MCSNANDDVMFDTVPGTHATVVRILLLACFSLLKNVSHTCVRTIRHTVVSLTAIVDWKMANGKSKV